MTTFYGDHVILMSAADSTRFGRVLAAADAMCAERVKGLEADVERLGVYLDARRKDFRQVASERDALQRRWDEHEARHRARILELESTAAEWRHRAELAESALRLAAIPAAQPAAAPVVTSAMRTVFDCALGESYNCWNGKAPLDVALTFKTPERADAFKSAYRTALSEVRGLTSATHVAIPVEEHERLKALDKNLAEPLQREIDQLRKLNNGWDCTWCRQVGDASTKDEGVAASRAHAVICLKNPARALELSLSAALQRATLAEAKMDAWRTEAEAARGTVAERDASTRATEHEHAKLEERHRDLALRFKRLNDMIPADLWPAKSTEDAMGHLVRGYENMRRETALRSTPRALAAEDIGLALKKYQGPATDQSYVNPNNYETIAAALNARALLAPAVDGFDVEACAGEIARHLNCEGTDYEHDIDSIIQTHIRAHLTRHARGEKSKAAGPHQGEVSDWPTTQTLDTGWRRADPALDPSVESARADRGPCGSGLREQAVEVPNGGKTGSETVDVGGPAAPSTPAATQWTNTQMLAATEVGRISAAMDSEGQFLHDPHDICAAIARAAPLFRKPVKLPSVEDVAGAIVGGAVPDNHVCSRAYHAELRTNSRHLAGVVLDVITAALASQGVETEGV